MQFAILGSLEVRVGDAVVEIRRGISRTLLIALILRAGETVSSDALVEMLWRDDQPQNPANALQIQISHLRKTLSAGDPAARQRIVTRPGGYLLDGAVVDSSQFERNVRDAVLLAGTGTAEALEAAAEALDASLAMWRGEPFADVAGEEFAIGETTRLSELRCEAIECRNDTLLALGRHQEVIGELSRIVTEHPLRERFHEQLMLGLYRADRQADALRAYEEARKLLVDELGLSPGPRLQKLERDVLAQDPALDWRAPRRADVVTHPRVGLPDSGRRRMPGPPIPVTPLVGRDVEIDRLQHLLGRNRIVTLTGPAGAGKTRLAIELANGHRDERRVVYVDLGGITQGDLVAATVAAVIGVAAPPDEDPADLVGRWFEQQPTLLVLDTCEHVLAGAAALASRVLRTSAGANVLTTSRRPLGIRGEVAWPVPPLALPPPSATTAEAIGGYPSVALFVERATAVRADFALTDSNAADVTAICFALDGLPLAIELAAARADALTPAAIRARLENRFGLLVDAGADVAARQQTLRAAIDWSFQLLGEQERRLFAVLSVFAGTFDLDAVTAVAGDDFDDPVDVLADLVRQSVVMVVGADRFRLLDSLRAYAAERLDAESPAWRRHAVCYSELAELTAPHVQGPEQVEWLDRARDDLANYRSALAWALSSGEDELAARLAGALAWFWTLEGMLDEAVHVFRRAAAIKTAPPVVRARILSGYGLLVASLGDLRGARDIGRESVELARVAGDPAVLGAALNTLAVAQWALGDLPAAAASHDEAIEHYERVDDRWGRAVCMSLRARTAIDAREPDANDQAELALLAARVAGDRHVLGISVEQLARIALISGDLEVASIRAMDCLTLQESIGYTEGMVAALHLLGRIRLAEADVAGARCLHLRALALADAIGHAAATCEAVEDLARVAVLDEHVEALRLLAVAERERTSRGITRRSSSFEAVDSIVRATRAALGPDADCVAAEVSGVTLDDVVRSLLHASAC